MTESQHRAVTIGEAAFNTFKSISGHVHMSWEEMDSKGREGWQTVAEAAIDQYFKNARGLFGSFGG